MKRAWRAPLALAFAFTLAGGRGAWGASVPLPSGEPPGSLDTQGRRWFRQGRLALAQSCYERLARLRPSSARVWYELGLVRAARGDYRRAADAQRLAIGHAPDYGPAYCALALDLRQRGQRAMSIWAVGQALRFMPGYAGAWNLWGALQTDAGHDRQAMRDYAWALHLEPDYPNAWFNQAELWQHLGRPDRARRALDRALALQPTYDAARLARADLFLDQGRIGRAEADFRGCLGHPEAAPEAWWGLRRIAAARGRRAAAARDLVHYREAVRRRNREQSRLAALGRERPNPYQPEVPGAAGAFGTFP